MANLDNSSWQVSVVKLAQAGNSRAIAFWLNRYLVPQGVCAQITTEASGSLAIHVVCRQVPDAERLIRFICHRLCKLDSEAIRHVRITAQVVGSPAVLWEKSARLIPPTERQERQQKAEDNVYAFPQPPAPEPASPAQPEDAVAAAALLSATPVQAAQPPAQAAKPAAQPAKPSRANSAARRPVRSAPKSNKPNKPKLKNFSKNWPRLSQSWQFTLQDKLEDLRLSSLDLTDRSVRWFARQKPAVRAAMLGGSAVTAFLIGCSFELVGYYADPTAFQQSKATLTKMFRVGSTHSGSVQTALERVPVIRQPVLNPDDPTVSLVFSNSDALTRLPAGQISMAQSPESSEQIPLATSIETYRQADMIVTNLNQPLSSMQLPQTKPVKDKKADEQADEQALEADPASETNESLEDPAAGSTDDQTSESAVAETSSAPEAAVTAEDDASAPADSETSEAVEDSDATSDATSDAASDQDTAPRKKSVSLMPRELMANGVDVVNLASDAVVSKGPSEFTETLNLLQQDNISAVGAGQNFSEARRPQIFDVKGQRIAYLGYSDASPFAVNATRAGVNVAVNQQMEEDIKAIRDQVDWVVVNFNWNRDLKAYPEAWQIDLAHAAIDHGADLVVGYHPTATQGAEIYNGRAIVYSLGNSIDEYSEKPVGNYDMAALKVTLKEHIMELEFLPIQVKQGQPEVAKGDLGATITEYFEQASSLFDHPLHAPTRLNAEVRLSLPAAPEAEMPTNPFISYPESPAADSKPAN